MVWQSAIIIKSHIFLFPLLIQRLYAFFVQMTLNNRPLITYMIETLIFRRIYTCLTGMARPEPTSPFEECLFFSSSFRLSERQMNSSIDIIRFSANSQKYLRFDDCFFCEQLELMKGSAVGSSQFGGHYRHYCRSREPSQSKYICRWASAQKRFQTGFPDGHNKPHWTKHWNFEECSSFVH